MGPIGFTDYSKYQREQDRQTAEREHKDKMTLYEAIYQGVHHPKENKTIGNLLREATAREKALVRAHLVKTMSENEGIGAPIEASCAERAIEAFDQGRYDHGHIARYLKPEVIERIFG